MKCYMIIGLDVNSGAYNIRIESVTGVFPIRYVEDLTAYIEDTVSSLDIYDGENFEDVQGYVQLTIHAASEFTPGVSSHDATFKIVDSYYHGYI